MSTTKELPTFRPDLTVTARLEPEGGFGYIVRDPEADTMFLLREEDYFICTYLDGNHTIEEVQSAFQKQYGRSMSCDQLQAFVRYLAGIGLLDTAPEESKDLVQGQGQAYQTGRIRRFGDPDRLFQIMASLFGVCFSWAFIGVVGVVVFAALGVFVKYSHDLVYDFQTVWELGHYVFFIVIGVLVSNFIGEVAKAVACRYYGGEVHEIGLRTIFRIFPRFYCDLSDVPWMPDKAVRLRIWGAGLILQVFIFSVSIIMWNQAVPLTDMSVFWMVIIVICMWTLFLNGNPLLARDAYLCLVTWLEVPALRSRAFQATRAWIRREPLPEPLSAREVRGFKWYAVLSVTFGLLLMFGVLALFGYVLITVLEGFGALLFLFILYRFFSSIRAFRTAGVEVDM